jgi:hypothetical protein
MTIPETCCTLPAISRHDDLRRLASFQLIAELVGGHFTRIS